MSEPEYADADPDYAQDTDADIQQSNEHVKPDDPTKIPVDEIDDASD